MDEKRAALQQQIAKSKIKIIIASIAEAIILVLELYIMINFKSNFIAMALCMLFMVVGLFFLISGIIDVNLQNKEIEVQKYDDIYNAQKASYLVIRKSFDEMDARLKVIEQNSQLPAEEIISAQKAVAKVTISRSKENTDALMNSNDELINHLFTIQEKLDGNNSEIIEKQQQMLNATKNELQTRIVELTNQIANIEGRMAGGVPVAMVQAPISNPVPMQAASFEPEEEAFGELTEDNEFNLDADISVEEELSDELSEDLGLDLDMDNPIEETEEDILEDVEEISEEVGIDLDMDLSIDEPQEADDLSLDLDMDSSAEVAEEIDEPLEELETEIPEEALEETEPELETSVEAEIEEEQPEEEEPVEEASAPEPVQIPDIGIDLSDPNRVMSPEEIEKLFASI